MMMAPLKNRDSRNSDDSEWVTVEEDACGLAAFTFKTAPLMKEIFQHFAMAARG